MFQRRWKRFLVPLLIWGILLSQFPIAALVKAENTTEPVYSLTWVNSGVGTISGNKLDITPSTNTEQKLVLQIEFALGDEQTAEPGEIEIRIPKSVITGRNGSAADTITVPLPMAPAVADGISYNYEIDGDDIVIKNYNSIDSATNLVCQIGYSFMPYQVENGYLNDGINADFKIALEGQQAQTLSTDALTLQVNTKIVAGTFSKSMRTKYEKWQTQWGTEPENSGDYFYVIWTLSYYNAANCTQPYTVTFDEEVGQYGTLVGGSTSSLGSNLQSEVPPISYSNPALSSLYTYRYVVVKYLRTEVENSANNTVTNKATANVKGVDGDVEYKSSSANYKYVSVNFTYSGNSFALTKSAYGSTSSNSANYGIINSIENDVSKKLGSGTNYSFNLYGTQRGYGLTLENGVYGQKQYTANIIDDLMYLGDEKLETGDYNISSFYFTGITEQDPYENENTGTLESIDNTNYGTYSPVIVYYKTSDSGTWLEAGTITRTASSSYVYYDSATLTTMTCSSSSQVKLPEGTCAVKFSHTSSRYSVYLDVYISVTLNPTDHVKSILAGKSSEVLYNISTLIVEDSEGIIRSSAYTSNINGTLTNAVIAHDKEKYNQTVYHRQSSMILTRLSSDTNISKTTGAIVSDPIKREERIPYTIDMYENGIYSQAIFTDAEAKGLGFVPEQTEGVFYDLLPAATAVDTSTISVRTYGTGNSCAFTTELIDNWQGSGQTMMIIKVSAPKTAQNYSVYTSSSYFRELRSGFTLKYTLVYTWQNISDYGIHTLNSIAYRSSTGMLSSGKSAEESGLVKSTYFSDLNNDSVADDKDKNTVYASNETNLIVLTAAQYGFTKKVKAADGLSYGETTEVSAAGTYSYQLRYQNSKSITASDVVFYDMLESYNSGNAYWNGTLESIDTTFAKNKGIAPVIYYSTVDSLNPQSNSTHADLTNTSIWSENAPTDLSTVTAIAVDMSKKSDGTLYEYAEEETILCYVTMRAPANYKEYTDPDIVYAYNSAYYKVTTKPVVGIPTTSILQSGNTKVSLRKPDITINKRSNPASGTEAVPTVVERGSTIEYTVSVTNTNTAEALTGLEITDAIPAGLTIDTTNIKCYYGTDSTSKELVSDSSRIGVTPNGQVLVFTVDKLSAGETVNLVIPVKVPTNAKAQTLYANTAAVTKFNGSTWDIKSDTTYHIAESTFGSLKISKTVDGTGASTTKEFAFTVTLKGENDTALTGSFAYTGSKSGTITSGGTIALKHGESITIAGIPDGITYTVTEADYTADGYTTTATGTTGTIVGNQTAQAAFENVRNTGGFTIKKVDADDTTKVLAGAEFTLKNDKDDNVYFTWDDTNKQYVYSETATSIILTSGENGLIVITGLPLGEYTLTESKAPASYYTASEDSWKITVSAEKVTSIEDTTLSWWESIVKAISSLLGIVYGDCLDVNGVLTVTNHYVLTPTKLTLTGSKNLTGKDLTDNMFSFEVKDKDQKIVSTGTNKADGSITFSEIELKAAGTYDYTVSEVNGGAGGITYDTTKYPVKVTVVDNGDGTLTATPTYPSGNIVFNNTYMASPTKVTLTGSKNLTGKDLTDNMFSFEVKDKDQKIVSTGTNKADGSITFSEIELKAAGTYSYTVSEVNGGAGGITYDTTKYPVTVSVVDNGDGTLTATPVYPDNDIVFNNNYTTDSTILSLKGTKKLTGKDLSNDMFSFVVKDETGETLSTGTNKADGSITFGEIGFETAGTYTYTVSEVKGNASGITYDTTEYKVTVTVVDNGDGTLTATAAYPETGIVFNNSYTTDSAGVILTGTKNLTGKDLTDDMFSFIVKDAEGKTVSTGTNKADGTIAFGEIGFEKAGTYIYTVSEVNGNASGITYDTTEYTITVTVVDNGDGTLTATTAYPEDSIVFNNSYTSSNDDNDDNNTSGNNTSGNNTPITGYSNHLWLFVILMTMSAIGIIYLIISKKKFRTEE